MSATYSGLVFETLLMAQWAAFFDLAGWEWSRGIAPVKNWKPDFRATFKCTHSECGGSHTILIAVLPIKDLSGVKGHPALEHRYGVSGSNNERLADAGAIFGSGPKFSYWEMSHGAGGGIEDIASWVEGADTLWEKAGSKIVGGNPQT